jgi:hypothetical protein
MITLPPYIYERDSYHQAPVADRWIFNKLQVSERLGHTCGPIGTRPAVQTAVIVRPQMNIFGEGRGGFFEYDEWPFAAWDNAPNANPGYFWCEQFTGRHAYTQYIDDVARWCSYSEPYTHAVNQRWVGVEDVALTEAPALPAALQGVSKYLYVESIGGNIIEAAPRLGMSGARQVMIDEYKLIDPTWVEPNDLGFGLVDAVMRPDIAGSLRWESDEATRRPFTTDQ